MAKILIVGFPNDTHVLAVQWALSRLGAESYVWMPSDLPDLSSASISLDAETGKSNIACEHAGEKVCLNDFDVMWHRRRGRIIAPDYASPFDKPVIEEECFYHSDNVIHLLARDMTTINPPAHDRVAERKAVQLQTARRVGFEIAPTLITNNAADARRFYEEHQPIIAKPYRPHGWVDDDKSYSQYTMDMPAPDEWRDGEIEMCPLIFQKRLVREMEARIIVFDETIFAARTVGASGATDSRMECVNSLFEQLEAIEIPPVIRERCIAYLRYLGIRFGAFDVIVDAKDNWYFLECNVGGQFLYLEEFAPDIPLLDAFSRWLIALAGGTPSSPERIRFAEFGDAEDVGAFLDSDRRHKSQTTSPTILETSQ